jgi:hypothetical protein
VSYHHRPAGNLAAMVVCFLVGGIWSLVVATTPIGWFALVGIFFIAASFVSLVFLAGRTCVGSPKD